MDPAKVPIVKDWPEPESKDNMQKCIGLGNQLGKIASHDEAAKVVCKAKTILHIMLAFKHWPGHERQTP